MIRLLTGTLTDRNEESVILTVGGVGYLIHTTKIPSRESLGTEFTYHTYLAVRETALDLYGFTSKDELELFSILVTLPKIGPKSALQILSQTDTATLAHAVTTNDAEYLVKTSGMGKKTAEKVVLGLQDKIESLAFSSHPEHLTQEANRAYVNDTIDALVALGYPQSEARRAVSQLPPTIHNANDAVREALKQLGSA